MTDVNDARIAVVVKCWPRLSETFIAQEMTGLEARGLKLVIYSLRLPTDPAIHPTAARVKAPIFYLPEYLHKDPLRVIKGWWKARKLPGYRAARARFLYDLVRDRTPNRIRRFGQAMILAAEMPPGIERLYAHFIHTPGSATRYAALMRGLPWSASAHAKDIWTSQEWELRKKLSDVDWIITCTQFARARLAELVPDDRLRLVYHGLDLANLPMPRRSARAATARIRLIRWCSCRSAAASPRKAMTTCSPHSRCCPRISTGASSISARACWAIRSSIWPSSSASATAAPGTARCRRPRSSRPTSAPISLSWPARPRATAIARACPTCCRRRGYQRMAIVSTRSAAIGEFVGDEDNGLMCDPGAPDQLAVALERLARDSDLRVRFGNRANEIIRTRFSYEAGVDWIARALAQPANTRLAAQLEIPEARAAE